MYFLPKLVRVGFGYAEGPGAAFGVAGVFPDGLDIFFEEAVRVSEREGGEGGVIEDLPEGLDGGISGVGFFFFCDFGVVGRGGDIPELY